MPQIRANEVSYFYTVAKGILVLSKSLRSTEFSNRNTKFSNVSSVSPVFERMFEGDFEEAVIPENIVLDDVSGPDFKRFVEYLYWHDNRRLDTYDLSTVQTLIYLSKKFMVSFMTLNCIAVLKRRLANGMDSDVTIDLYEYAHQLEEEGLLNSIRSVCF